MTRPNRQHSTESTENQRTMREVSHTHPYTDRGATTDLFARGPRVATDGGRNRRRPTMADVDHTPPRGAPDANGVFERGNEGK